MWPVKLKKYKNVTSEVAVYSLDLHYDGNTHSNTVVWCHKKVVGKHLKIVQRLACVAITGAIITTPTAAI